MPSMIVSRTLSMPVFEAASISSTSIERLSAISMHETHAVGSSILQGFIFGPEVLWQFRAFASSLAVVVLPTPPFWFAIAMTRATCLYAWLDGRSGWPLVGAPSAEQRFRGPQCISFFARLLKLWHVAHPTQKSPPVFGGLFFHAVRVSRAIGQARNATEPSRRRLPSAVPDSPE